MCALLKSIPVSFQVLANVNIEVYTDPEMTQVVSEYEVGPIHRGDYQQVPVYIKNLGETITLQVTTNMPYTAVIPSTVQMNMETSAVINLVIEIPWDAPEESYSGTVEFNTV